MDAATYQREAGRTLIDAPPQPLTDAQHMIVWCALGLMGEAGEVFYLAPDDASAQAILWRSAQLAEHLKKAFFHEQGLDPALVHSLLECVARSAVVLWTVQPKGSGVEPLQKELGDLLWYLAALSTKLGWALAEVLHPRDAHALGHVFQANIDKLRVRFPDGWSTTDAAARVDVTTRT